MVYHRSPRRAMLPRLVIGSLACSLLALPATAQEPDGVVEGIVTAADGVPLAGATVRLLQPRIVVTAGPNGRYLLARIPAGRYTVRIEAVDYLPVEGDLRVWSGRTVTLDARLERRLTDPQAVVTYGELTPPAIPLFPEASSWAVPGDVVTALPVDDLNDVVVLQPGVVETPFGTSVRGGAPGDFLLFVDGVPVRSTRTGRSDIVVGTNTIEELSVATGVLAAPFGDTQAGVISVARPAVTRPLRVALAYESDEPFGAGTRVGFNRLEAAVAAQLVPALTLSVGGTLQGERGDRRGKGADDVAAFLPGAPDTTVLRAPGEPVEIPTFVQFSGDCDAQANFGIDCHGRRFPLDWTTLATLDGTVQWAYRDRSRLSLTTLFDVLQDRAWPAHLSFNPDAYAGTRSTGKVYTLRWLHELARGADRELSVDIAVSHQRNAVVSGPLEPAWERAHRAPFAGIALSPMDFLVDFDRFSDDTGPDAVPALDSDADWERLVQNVLTASGTRVPFLNRVELLASQPFRMNPWALSMGMPTQGVDVLGAPIALARERRWYGQGQIVWRSNAWHRIAFGAEWQSSRVQSFRGQLVRLQNHEVFDESPVRWAVYAHDRLVLGAATVELGLRWDRFASRALYPVVPGRITSNPAFDPATFMNPAAGVLRDAQTHQAVSPRVRMALRLSDRTGIRVGFAQQVRSPDLASSIAGKNHDLSFVSASSGFGGDVGLARVLQVEAGVRHALLPSITLDFAAFAKPSIDSWAPRFQRFFDPATLDSIDALVLTTVDRGQAFGAELAIVGRVSGWFHGQLSYTLEDARQEIPSPFGASTNRPAGFERRYTLAGWFALEVPGGVAPGRWYGAVLRNGGAYGQFRFASGLPYTRLRASGIGIVAPPGVLIGSIEPLNASRLPWVKTFDLRLAKGFQLGAATLTAYADARNLFNFTNTVAVFAETGGTTNDLHREAFVNPELARLEQDAGTRLMQITKNGNTLSAVDLRGDCSDWGGTGGVVDCVLLRRAEARWGDGDEVYDLDEQLSAFNAAYDLLNGAYRLLEPGRHLRIGIELGF